MSVFVYIATTQGLVQVQSIIAEDPEIQSVVCVDGAFEALPISAAYHQFVKKGSGIIHKDFGHGAFRVDVSARIDQGNSWQLGLYLAHYLESCNCFFQGLPQPGDKIIWATGVIKADKRLAGVAGIGQKLAQSESYFELWQQQGIEVLCFLPADNLEDVTEHLNEEPPLVEAMWAEQSIQALASVDEVLLQLNDWFKPAEAATASADILQPEPVLEPKLPEHKAKPVQAFRWHWPVVCAATLGLAAWQWWPTSTAIDEAGLTTTVATEPHQLTTHVAVQMKVKLKQYGGCANGLSEILNPQQGRFTPVRLEYICQLQLHLADVDTRVLGIALDTGGNIPLEDLQDGYWEIPVPSSKYQNRDYLLLLMPSSFASQRSNPLVQKIRRWRWNDKALSARLIKDWVTQNNWPVEVFSHRLEDD